MSSHKQTQQFLEKLEELKALFVLGRRSFPFLEHLFCFVQDITVLLEEVNDTIRSRTGDMPRATSQLKSVSEATELATNEILDIIDDVFGELRGLEEGQKATTQCVDDLAAADAELMALLEEELGEEHSTVLEQAKRITAKKRTLREEGKSGLETAREALAPVRAKMNHIMMSLQVQDITAQQIASVNHLIESVRQRMDALLDRLGSGQANAGMPKTNPGRTATFDENARYDHSPDRQKMADDLVASTQKHAPGSNGQDASAAQGDGAASATPPSAEAGASAGDSHQPGSGQAASQSDIDDMFSNHSGGGEAGASAAEDGEAEEAKPSEEASKGGGVASQQDIDELFQGGL